MAKKNEENLAAAEELTEEIEAATEELEDEVEKEVEKVAKPKKAKDPNAALKEFVPIKLLKDKQHTDDVIVRVNGYAYQIKRGVQVMVPRYIKEVLDNKELQEQEALDRSLELQIDPNDKAFQ